MAMSCPISVIILARNEEERLADCLHSCSFAQEIIVIDDFSTDQTLSIAQSHGCRVFQRALDGDFAAQRMFGLSKATQPWVLFIDADERVSEQLQAEIIEVVQANQPVSCDIQRENHFVSGKATHGIMRPDWVLRLMPKAGTCVQGKVHETILSDAPRMRLHGRLVHFPYRDWDHYWSKFDAYTKLSAQKYHENHRQCHFFSDIVLRPLWAFFKIYVLNLGFLDGRLGWIFSVNHYFYTMTKYVRLYTLQKTNGKL